MTTDQQPQELRQGYPWLGAAELLPHITDAENATPAELDAVRDYQHRTAGIPDCFDVISQEQAQAPSPDDLQYLITIVPYLGQWWEAIDSLDSGLRQNGQGQLSTLGQAVLQHELHTWFRVRQHTLLAIAHHVGAPMPQPDVDGHGGYVSTSHGTYGVHFAGHFGYLPIGSTA